MPSLGSDSLSGIDTSRLTAGERVVLDAAQEKNGGFSTQLICGRMDGGAILSDGHIAYILGSPDLAFQSLLDEISHESLLGKEDIVRRFCSKNKYLLIRKNFAFYQAAIPPITPDVPEDLSIKPVRTEDELRKFCTLKAEFFFEESGVRADVEVSLRSLRKEFHAINPVCLWHKGKMMGMVCSQLRSKRNAMINMLFIASEERGNGYGSLLLRWYMAYLSRESFCLFYSPNNAPAMKLYKSLGFEEKEDWMLALKK